MRKGESEERGRGESEERGGRREGEGGGRCCVGVVGMMHW